MLTLIENGFVYSPEPRGVQSVLLAGDRIAKIGDVDRRAIEAAGLDLDVIDARDCLITPGFIDPHEHLVGGSGEQGFAAQTPEIFLSEIITAGITTVVGCLGVDAATKTMPGLLARAKALNEEGLTTFVWSGGYNAPHATITGSLRDDLIFIDVDTMEENLPEQLRRFLDDNGDLSRLTVSSDAVISSQRALREQIRACVVERGFTLELVLPLATSNTARVLKLDRKGRLEQGMDADALVLRRKTLEISRLFARGKQMIRGGELVVADKFLTNSNRRIALYGRKS